MAFPDGTIDFRSDTVTRPTSEMRRAMAEAEVGDDAYGEDPTVSALEDESAEAVGKEAGLFVPTGTMGNQLAINCLTSPGEGVLALPGAHLRLIERGAASVFSGVHFRIVGDEAGVITPGQIESELADAALQGGRVTLLAWEDTYQAAGGAVVPAESVAGGSQAARSNGMAVHLDGARIFNASIAAGVAPARFADEVDTVMFCFSKGLGAPVGSVLCGSRELIAEARYRRKRFGGAMRQAGVIAAAARIGLRDRDRLSEDHALAGRLADVVGDRFPKAIDPDQVQTNMVLVDEGGLSCSAVELRNHLGEAGIKVGITRRGMLRFVTHRDVDRQDLDRLGKALDRL